MNKKFTKLMAALALLVFMAPNMVGWGQTRDEVVAYTLTPASGSNNGYASNCDITINGITWNLTGNSQVQPWRIGGKSLTNVDRNLYSKTAIADNITKIEVTHGEASGITVNSWTVIVATDDDFSTVVSTLTPTFEASTTTTITRPEGADWTGCYYKFVYNVTVSGSSNKFLQFTEAKFYKESAATYTLTDESGQYGSISFNPASPVAAGTHVTLTPTPVSAAYYFVDNSWSFFDDELENVTEDIEFVEGEANTIVMPAYNLHVDATFNAKPTNGITCTVNNSDWGTLEASPTSAYEGQTVTLSYLAETGYRLSSIAITKTEDGSATGITPVESGDDFTFEMPAYAVTATATFEAIPTYTITFHAGSGTCATASLSGLENSTITLPTADPSAACASRGWEFAGWATASVSETNTAPALLNGQYTVTGNATLYAVYQVTEGGENTVTDDVFQYGSYDSEQGTITWTKTGVVTILQEQNGAQTAPNSNYVTAPRWYSGNKITITQTVGLNSITVTASSEGYATTLANSTYTNATASANGSTVTITPSNTSDITIVMGGQARLSSLIVAYGSSTTTYNSNPSCFPMVATPTFTPAEGTYTGAQNVTINCTTEDASILYKTTEEGEWLTYNNPIPVSTTTTIWAKATKQGMDDSEVAEAAYTIQYILTVDIDDMVEYFLYDYTNQTWEGITIDNDGHALVSSGADVRISGGEVYDDCYEVESFNVTDGNGNIVTVVDNTEEDGTYSFIMPASNATLTVILDEIATHYTLTVEGLNHVSFELLVGAMSSITTLDANRQASICEHSMVEIDILTVGNGYVLESVTLTTPDNEPIELTKDAESGLYNFEMPSSNATLAFIIGNASYFEAFTGELTEGDYLIVYNGKAMKNSVTNNRLDYIEVTATNDIICADNSIIWHIAPSGDYWTIYSADAEAYAAGNGTNNQAQMLADGTDNKALWTVSGNEEFEFVNKYNSENYKNANLRNNGTYGFACYNPNNIGGALSLYKKVTPQNYTTMEIQPNQWYFIASPTGTSPTNVEDLSDLYYYDEQDHYWRNQKVFANAEGFVNFDLGKGYLAANAGESVTESVTLTFTGVAITANSYSVDLEYNANTSGNETNTLAGWNLVGNPFPSSATINKDFYVISGRNVVANTGSTVIAPCTGVMVQAEGENESVTFTKVAEGQTPQPNQLQMTVAQNATNRGTAETIDNAIVSFNEGSQLEKFIFNADLSKLYISQNGKDYAIVSAEAQGEMPVNFRAAENGTYTLTVNPEGVEMNYLHLIDNMTGANIDLLQTPSYTFNATTSDYQSRFRLVFAASNNANADSEADSFAFFSNGSWIINNVGEATLQVVDITGRILSSERVNGSVSTSINATTGVYMLRLINGENVKVQKIVVR